MGHYKDDTHFDLSAEEIAALHRDNAEHRTNISKLNPNTESEANAIFRKQVAHATGKYSDAKRAYIDAIRQYEQAKADFNKAMKKADETYMDTMRDLGAL
jgi:hypothetical protein